MLFFFSIMEHIRPLSRSLYDDFPPKTQQPDNSPPEPAVSALVFFSGSVSDTVSGAVSGAVYGTVSVIDSVSISHPVFDFVPLSATVLDSTSVSAFVFDTVFVSFSIRFDFRYRWDAGHAFIGDT